MPEPDLSWFVGSVYFWITLIASIPGAITFIALVITRTRSYQSLEDDYYDYDRELRIITFDLEIKYANNPIFRKFKLFSYDGRGIYDVSGTITKIPENIFEERPCGHLNKEGLKEVWVKKSFF